MDQKGKIKKEPKEHGQKKNKKGKPINNKPEVFSEGIILTKEGNKK